MRSPRLFLSLSLALLLLVPGLPLVVAVSTDAGLPAGSADQPTITLAMVAPVMPGASETFTLVGPGGLDLTGWVVTDGEGVLHLHGSLPDTGRLVLTADGSRHLASEAYAGNWSGAAPDYPTNGTLALRDEGDSLLLIDAAGILRAWVAWGDELGPAGAEDLGSWYPKPGRWEYLSGTGDGRVRVGADPFPILAGLAEVETIMTPTSPAAIIDHLDSASRSIIVDVYTLSSPMISAALIAAAGRGVRVVVIVEGQPVGGWGASQEATADRLVDGGVTVVRHQADAKGYRDYRFDHSKVAIIDGHLTLIGTENWGDSAYPSDDSPGNRGFLVAIHADALALDLIGYLFSELDEGESDWILHDPSTNLSSASDWPVMEDPVPRFKNVAFRVLFGPESNRMLLDDGRAGLLEEIWAADESVEVEFFYLDTWWGPGDDPTSPRGPWLDALVAAAERGVEVRVLLDSTFYNIEAYDDNDNDDTVRYLNGLSIVGTGTIEARLIAADDLGLLKLHAKAMVVDDRHLLVSSVNGNQNSPTRNREMSIWVDDPDSAAVFLEAFEADWAVSGGFVPDAGDRVWWPWVIIGGLILVVVIVLILRTTFR